MVNICRKLLTQEATFSELRSQARHIFDRVEAGEIIRVLRSGRPFAQIHPIASNPPSWKQRPARPLAISGKEIGRLIVAARRG